ncbi:MAG: ATP-binding cassette domain-containing protein [Clostridia bacterium]|nr:ATP-binding cassette domain-containing protein [Anaerostipes sp.]NCB94399.1 ATP-binding cassette domain-containing protein [Clostridia bacterium]NCC44295.1 ATP-binding cassette domain-containing protein [Clostridia bacterium]
MIISNVEKKVGDFEIKINDLYIEAGKIHGIIGANGSGKTTLCKLIMGILDAESGQVDYQGINPKDITMASQRPYFTHNSVYENICYPLKLRHRKIDEGRIDSLLEMCGLSDKKYQYARSLSSGEQQKVSMLRALVFEPEVIMIDETLSNLDPETTELFEQMILEQQKRKPVTWILISHRLAHIYKMCDQVHFMYRGSVIESGESREILFESEDKRIREFVANEVIKVEDGHGITES